jgi:hypothetical protein
MPENRAGEPWAAQEFAVLDATTVCVVFRQRSAARRGAG